MAFAGVLSQVGDVLVGFAGDEESAILKKILRRFP